MKKGKRFRSPFGPQQPLYLFPARQEGESGGVEPEGRLIALRNPPTNSSTKLPWVSVRTTVPPGALMPEACPLASSYLGVINSAS